jgi:hypothetical protein
MPFSNRTFKTTHQKYSIGRDRHVGILLGDGLTEIFPIFSILPYKFWGNEKCTHTLGQLRGTDHLTDPSRDRTIRIHTHGLS